MESVEVVLADKNGSKAEEVADNIRGADVSWIQLDASDHNQLTSALEDFDLVMGFLPGDLGHRLAIGCIDTGKDFVDVSYMAENCLELNKHAREAGVTIIPDCGLAPGISNILVGHASKMIDNVRTVHIMVGGLPERQVPPLDYVITWSPENLIDEYTRKAKIVEDGELVEVEALSGLEEVEFPDVGRLEAFYTDGLRTLPYTIKNVKEMWEKTLRYPGHAEKIRFLRALGFFGKEPVVVNGVRISPKRFTARLFDHKLRRPEIKDIVAMRVEVSGFRNGGQIHYVYSLMDRYDENRGTTAMARTTAYSASIVAQLTVADMVNMKGVVPTEKLGMDEEFFSTFLKELEDRGVRITETLME
jgi:saccharopine dehydrogenase-like NADP-dependent oxidoreductase